MAFKHALYEWMAQMENVQSTEELHAQTPDLMSDKVFRPGWVPSMMLYKAKLCLGDLLLLFRVLIYFHSRSNSTFG